MSDYFLQNPSALFGQPKATIADYVEQNGVLVPSRFGSLDEVLKTGKPFIIRSEHEQEYNGVSGLLHSSTISDEVIEKDARLLTKYKIEGWPKSTSEEQKIMIEVIGRIRELDQYEVEKRLIEECGSYIEHYCKRLGVKKETFINGISYSYWELLSGFNRKIIADSAVKGRYHIFTTDANLHNYTVVDNGEIVFSLPRHLPFELRKGLDEVIKFYEKIRNLDNFDSNHCPIVEFQTVDGNHYFLQYHRTRDFTPSTFTLDRTPAKGEVEVDFVRGATASEGTNVKVSIAYDWWHAGVIGERIKSIVNLEEEGSVDAHPDFVFTEVMSKIRKLNLIYRPIEWVAIETIEGHLPVSTLFKSEISVALPEERLMPRKEWDKCFEACEPDSGPVSIDVYLVSDGRKSYIKRI